jgi:hypothetical protein
VKLVRLSWLSWLLAALIFASGTAGAGALVVLLVAIGFVLSGAAFLRALLANHA